MQYNGGEITAEEWKKRYNEITDGDYYQATIDAINSIHLNIDKVLEDVVSGTDKKSITDSLKDQLSQYDKVLSAIERRYDKEIDAIDDAIDAIEKQNDKLEEQLDN